jgi:hypothetical protein
MMKRLLVTTTTAAVVAGAITAAWSFGNEVPDSDQTLAPPAATSSEVLVDWWMDYSTNQVTEVYEYEYADGLCTRLERTTIPYQARLDDPDPDPEPEPENPEDGHSLVCEPDPEEELLARGVADESESESADVSMRSVVLGEDLIVYPRLSERVARVAIERPGRVAAAWPAAASKPVEGERHRIAHVVLPAPQTKAAASARASGDAPPPPAISAEAKALRLVAYDAEGDEIATVPVFASP